jgi:hypothetical protein
VRRFRQREASYGMWYFQVTVWVSFVAWRFPVSVNLNDVNRNRNTFLEMVSSVGCRMKRLKEGPITAFSIITFRI